jgi:hypothetical protein
MLCKYESLNNINGSNPYLNRLPRPSHPPGIRNPIHMSEADRIESLNTRKWAKAIPLVRTMIKLVWAEEMTFIDTLNNMRELPVVSVSGSKWSSDEVGLYRIKDSLGNCTEQLNFEIQCRRCVDEISLSFI